MNNDEKVIRSILSKITEQDARVFLETNELPAIKLTRDEMDFINGGGLWKRITGKTFEDWLHDKFPLKYKGD